MKEDKKKERGEVSRRDFLIGAGAVVVGGAVGAGIAYPLAGGGDGEGGVTTTTKVNTVTVPTTVTTTKTLSEGDIVTTTLTSVSTTTKTVDGGGTGVEPWQEPETTVIKAHSLCSFSGGGEFVATDVKNGKIVRLRPLHYDETGYTQDDLAPAMWEITARGKTFRPLMKSLPSYFAMAYKERVYSPNRILYPMKRVDWDPDADPTTGRNTQNRGNSKFKRITWNEAADIVANEITRIQDTYGPYSLLCMGDGHGESKTLHGPHGCHKKLMPKWGYTDSVRNADSWEGWMWGSQHVWGTMYIGHMVPDTNVLSDVAENTDMIVWQGGDWETTPDGFHGRWYSRIIRWYKNIGIYMLYICPELNYAAAVHGNKWIPVLPNTDAAMQLAVIYTWIDEDLYDKDYVDTHAVGFDEFKAYIMGDEDGVPKTPEWASERCGVPEWTIKAVARVWASKATSTGHYFGGSFIRGPYSHEPARLENIQLGMQKLGTPGVHQIHGGIVPPAISTMLNARGAGSPTLPWEGPDQTLSSGPTPSGTTPQFIPKTQFHYSILEGHSERWSTTGLGVPVEDQFNKYVYPLPEEDHGSKIHMCWIDNPCHTACWNDGNKFIEAFKSTEIECIVVQHPWFENDAQFADIVLPSNTLFEEDDILGAGKRCGQLRTISLDEKAIEPIGESLSDYEVVGEVAKKLGAYDEYTGGKTNDEWIRNGFDNSGVQELISWEEFKEKKFYAPPFNPAWHDTPAGLYNFAMDPVNNPLGTPSGKLEFYSSRLAENFPDDEERGPYPKWVTGGPGFTHDESLWGSRAANYPLILMANHPRWREHVNCDDIPWLREIPTCKIKGSDGYMYEPLWINPADAADRDIRNGEIVKVYNDRGAVLGAAYVTERIRSGAVYMDHGAHLDPITDSIDRGGSINLISPMPGSSKHCWGMATSGYLAEVEKLSGDEYAQLKRDYPKAFARDYDPAHGLKFSAWVEGGM